MLRFFLLGEVGIKGLGGEGYGSWVRCTGEGMMHRRGPPDIEVCFGSFYFPPSRPYFSSVSGCSLAEKPLPISGAGSMVGALATLAKLVLLEI